MVIIEKHYDIKVESGVPKAVVKELIGTDLEEEKNLPEERGW
jgi:hypothetical protein